MDMQRCDRVELDVHVTPIGQVTPQAMTVVGLQFGGNYQELTWRFVIAYPRYAADGLTADGGKASVDPRCALMQLVRGGFLRHRVEQLLLQLG